MTSGPAPPFVMPAKLLPACFNPGAGIQGIHGNATSHPQRVNKRLRTFFVKFGRKVMAPQRHDLGQWGPWELQGPIVAGLSMTGYLSARMKTRPPGGRVFQIGSLPCISRHDIQGFQPGVPLWNSPLQSGRGPQSVRLVEARGGRLHGQQHPGQ